MRFSTEQHPVVFRVIKKDSRGKQGRGGREDYVENLIKILKLHLICKIE